MNETWNVRRAQTFTIYRCTSSHRPDLSLIGMTQTCSGGQTENKNLCFNESRVHPSVRHALQYKDKKIVALNKREVRGSDTNSVYIEYIGFNILF